MLLFSAMFEENVGAAVPAAISGGRTIPSSSESVLPCQASVLAWRAARQAGAVVLNSKRTLLRHSAAQR